MNGFQVIALLILAVMCVGSIRQWLRTRRWSVLAWAGLWIVSGIAIAFPDLSSRLALAMGIGRGVDIVLYLAMLFTLFGFFWVFERLYRLSQQITVLTREMAFLSAKLDEQRGTSDHDAIVREQRNAARPGPPDEIAAPRGRIDEKIHA